MARTLATVVFVVVFATACASSSFSGSGGTKQGAKIAQPSKKDDTSGKKPTGGSGDATDLGRTSEGTANPTTTVDGDQTDVITPNEPAKVPKFAMLLNDLRCAMCHVTVKGDIVSTAPSVGDWSGHHTGISDEVVTGRWLAAGSWTDKADDGSQYNITVQGGVKQSYSGPEMPKGFPRIDFDAAKSRMTTQNGNVTLLGSASAPIKLAGSYLIDGDLVIKGVYTGIATLYVTGRIYIAGDVRAADAQKDALGLASKSSIFIGSLDSGIFDAPMVPQNQTRSALGVDDVYSWKGDYASLVEANGDLRVDAYLYAAASIAGRTQGNWAINGGVIADTMHLLGTGAGRNTITFDERMKNGLRILGELAPYFE